MRAAFLPNRKKQPLKKLIKNDMLTKDNLEYKGVTGHVGTFKICKY